MNNLKIANLIESISDYIFEINNLIFEEEKNKVGDYDGIFRIKKMPSINSLKCLSIETDLYGIIRDKRKIIIEKVDIGVEIDRNTKIKEEQLNNNNKTKIEYDK